ncbi:MAG TPA: M64 family metallopeptidase [Bacteroidales bacterium]|nr:M64 family metallopeptidase [Bacteroidales bacterium]HRZ20470.1 M64 family metallopeptidase [Bacteroidales bacterium]
MRSLFIFLLMGMLFKGTAQFDAYFENKSLRIDYQHAGNSTEDFYFLDEVKIEPFWGGSRTNLIDPFGYGEYQIKVFDQSSGQLIFSRGYSTLFMEWQTTAEAKKLQKSFSETVCLPLPKKPARIEFYTRNRAGDFEKKYEYAFNPSDYFIHPEQRMIFPVFDVQVNGDPSQKVDIVILPDGYTSRELKKFKKDCQQFAGILFSFEPFRSNRSKFNIRGVLAPSQEPGNDIPADGVWKNSILETSFYTFDSERYCMTRANKTMADLAANAPYDQIYILVNQDKYGGGGIFNQYCVSVSGNLSSAKIIVHEFGHGFAGLGDEYVGDVSYNEFYPLDVEPWEPNLTTLVHFDRKWGAMITPGVPVPTPDTKEYEQVIGVFEGGGYATKGVYRPVHDCLMNTFDGDVFCGVCRDAIQRMIDFHSK